MKRLLQNFAIQSLISSSGYCQQAVNLVNLLLSSFVASCTGSGFLVPDILKVTLQQYINMQTAQFDEINHNQVYLFLKWAKNLLNEDNVALTAWA